MSSSEGFSQGRRSARVDGAAGGAGRRVRRDSWKQQSLYKTELCRSWEESGSCPYGTKCQFAHGADELRPLQRHPKYKTEVCRSFHSTGTCPYGTRCRFIHISREVDMRQKRLIPLPAPGGDSLNFKAFDEGLPPAYCANSHSREVSPNGGSDADETGSCGDTVSVGSDDALAHLHGGYSDVAREGAADAAAHDSLDLSDELAEEAAPDSTADSVMVSKDRPSRRRLNFMSKSLPSELEDTLPEESGLRLATTPPKTRTRRAHSESAADSACVVPTLGAGLKPIVEVRRLSIFARIAPVEGPEECVEAADAAATAAAEAVAATSIQQREAGEDKCAAGVTAALSVLDLGHSSRVIRPPQMLQRSLSEEKTMRTHMFADAAEQSVLDCGPVQVGKTRQRELRHTFGC